MHKGFSAALDVLTNAPQCVMTNFVSWDDAIQRNSQINREQLSRIVRYEKIKKVNAINPRWRVFENNSLITTIYAVIIQCVLQCVDLL